MCVVGLSVETDVMSMEMCVPKAVSGRCCTAAFHTVLDAVHGRGPGWLSRSLVCGWTSGVRAGTQHAAKLLVHLETSERGPPWCGLLFLGSAGADYARVAESSFWGERLVDRESWQWFLLLPRWEEGSADSSWSPGVTSGLWRAYNQNSQDEHHHPSCCRHQTRRPDTEDTSRIAEVLLRLADDAGRGLHVSHSRRTKRLRPRRAPCPRRRAPELFSHGWGRSDPAQVTVVGVTAPSQELTCGAPVLSPLVINRGACRQA